MCGTLKHGRGSTSLNKIGDPLVPVVNKTNGKAGDAKWSGFARIESSFWQRADPVKINVLASSFIEGKVELKLPDHIALQGIGLRKSVYVHGKLVGESKTFKILTRAAQNDFECSITASKKNKHRIPLCIDSITGNEYIFTPSDVISGQGSLKL